MDPHLRELDRAGPVRGRRLVRAAPGTRVTVALVARLANGPIAPAGNIGRS